MTSVQLHGLVATGLLLDILSQDWFDWLALAGWLYDAWIWLGMAIFFIITGVVGFANHRLPKRDAIKPSQFVGETLGDNTRLSQLLAQFTHHHDDTGQATDGTPTQASASTTDHTVSQTNRQNQHDQQQGLSGIYPIDEGSDALSVRLLLARLAEVSLDLQYYMWHDDASGRLLFHEVEKAANRGVRVRLLLDDNNTAGMDAVLQTLNRHPNIEIRLFNPFMNRRFRILGYLTALKRLNRRMHNKSFTVDNQISVFGGRNIGDEYFDVNEKMNFADLDVVAIGHVVDDISQDFDRYWNCAASFPFELIVTREYRSVDLSQVNHKEYHSVAQLYQAQMSQCDFLHNLEQGNLDFIWVPVTFVSDPPTKALPDTLLEQAAATLTDAQKQTQKQTPTTDTSKHLIHQISDTLLSPKHSLTIVSPYFVPSGKWAQHFVSLAERGVTLNILTNSLNANDVLAVHAGYIRYRQMLLQGNVRLFELKSKRSMLRHSVGLGSSSIGGSHGADSATDKTTADADTALAPNAKLGQGQPLQAPTTDHRPTYGKPTYHKPSRYYRRQHRERYRWLNRSTSSLHAKTFSVDGERLFVGSFNFDPRSAALNTEMGAIIESPTLARQLDSMIDKWTTELSYVVSIEGDKLQWADNSANPAAIFQGEPDTSLRQRLMVRLLGRLPIEDFL